MIPFAGYWQPSEDKDRGCGGLRAILYDIVPPSDRGATRLRQNIATRILNTYRERGWLPRPNKKGLLGFGREKDPLLETIEELCK